MALAGKMDEKNYKVYVLMGDGELAEGSIWEGAMAAGHYKLDNLIGIIDRNHLQISGNTENIMSLENLKEKWNSFGWNVLVEMVITLKICLSVPVEQVVDTTGAGGCFIAGFLHGMIQWGDIPQAIKIANLTASYSIQKKGAAISFPNKSEIDWKKLE
jgi:hypothetical protein